MSRQHFLLLPSTRSAAQANRRRYMISKMLTSTDDMKAHRQQHVTSCSLSVAATANQEKTFFSSAAESGQQPHLLVQQTRLDDTNDIANSPSIASMNAASILTAANQL